VLMTTRRNGRPLRVSEFSFRQWVQVVRDRLRSLAQLVRTVLWSLWGDSGGEVEWS